MTHKMAVFLNIFVISSTDTAHRAQLRRVGTAHHLFFGGHCQPYIFSFLGARGGRPGPIPLTPYGGVGGEGLGEGAGGTYKKAPGPLPQINHLSTSASTMSMVPIIAIMSDSKRPRASLSRAARTTKDGPLIFSRKGLGPPSLTT